jgi:hypothetical protein
MQQFAIAGRERIISGSHWQRAHTQLPVKQRLPGLPQLQHGLDPVIKSLKKVLTRFAF